MEKYRVNEEGRKVALRFQAFAVAILLLVTGSPLTHSIAATLTETGAIPKSADHAIPVSFFWLFTLGVAGLILLARVIQNIRHQNRVYLHHRHRPSLLDSRNK